MNYKSMQASPDRERNKERLKYFVIKSRDVNQSATVPEYASEIGAGGSSPKKDITKHDSVMGFDSPRKSQFGDYTDASPFMHKRAQSMNKSRGSVAGFFEPDYESADYQRWIQQ